MTILLREAQNLLGQLLRLDAPCVQEFGESYKWLLYGDDDTVFFPEAALQLLAGFDPDLPYAITDNMWFEESLVAQPPFRHPAAGAPRCLPCHFADSPHALRMFTGMQIFHNLNPLS